MLDLLGNQSFEQGGLKQEQWREIFIQLPRTRIFKKLPAELKVLEVLAIWCGVKKSYTRRRKC